MKYDPIKKTLGNFFNKAPWMRKLFYRMLDVLLLRTWHIKKEIRKFAKDRESKLHVLDAGSGFGQYDYFMGSSHKGWNIEAVDVKKDQIEDCSRFFDKIGYDHVSFDVADLTQFRKENTYDFILSVDVMEHIEEDVQVFKNFHSSLKNGGMVLISTPSDQGGSDVHEHDEHYNNDGTRSFIDEHVRDGYNINEIQEKLKSAGFTKTEAHYQYGSPGKISWRLSMKYPILMLNTSKIFFIVLPFYYIITFPFAMMLNWMDVNFKHNTGTGLIVKAYK